MTTTTNPNTGPHMMRTSNTPLYWGVAILAAVIIVLALLMRPTRVSTATTESVVAAQAADTTPATNALQTQQVDSATGAIIQNYSNPAYDANRVPSGSDARVNGMAIDPRREQLHNGANSPNGGIAPNNNPASRPPNTSPSGN